MNTSFLCFYQLGNTLCSSPFSSTRFICSWRHGKLAMHKHNAEKNISNVKIKLYREGVLNYWLANQKFRTHCYMSLYCTSDGRIVYVHASEDWRRKRIDPISAAFLQSGAPEVEICEANNWLLLPACDEPMRRLRERRTERRARIDQYSVPHVDDCFESSREPAMMAWTAAVDCNWTDADWNLDRSIGRSRQAANANSSWSSSCDPLSPWSRTTHMAH